MLVQSPSVVHGIPVATLPLLDVLDEVLLDVVELVELDVLDEVLLDVVELVELDVVELELDVDEVLEVVDVEPVLLVEELVEVDVVEPVRTPVDPPVLMLVLVLDVADAPPAPNPLPRSETPPVCRPHAPARMSVRPTMPPMPSARSLSTFSIFAQRRPLVSVKAIRELQDTA